MFDTEANVTLYAYSKGDWYQFYRHIVCDWHTTCSLPSYLSPRHGMATCSSCHVMDIHV